MWAVGRLSLLSSGLDAAKRARAAPKKPVAVAPVASVPPLPPAIPGPIPAPMPPEPVKVTVGEVSVPVEAPGLVQRIVTRVTRFFRSLFG